MDDIFFIKRVMYVDQNLFGKLLAAAAAKFLLDIFLVFSLNIRGSNLLSF